MHKKIAKFLFYLVYKFFIKMHQLGENLKALKKKIQFF